MKIYYAGVVSTEKHAERYVTEDKYFLKKESALEYKEELKEDKDSLVKISNGERVTFFEEIDVIED